MVDLKALKSLASEAAQLEDQTKVSASGDFEYQIPPAGKTVGRLLEYIELGKQPQRPYQGKPRPAAEEVRITFELLHPTKNIREIEVDGEKRQIADRITITVPKKLNDKAKYVSLFKAMQYGRDDITHMAQMLDEVFVFNIVHNVVKGANGAPDKTYANIYKDKQWLVSAPFEVDAMTEEKKHYNAPACLSPHRLFIQQVPTKDTWDSLFIDGTRTAKDEKGNEKEVSKNYLQEKLLRAADFENSALHQMLLGANALPDLADLGEEMAEDDGLAGLEQEEEEEAPKAAPAKAQKPATTKAASVASGQKAATSAKTASPSKAKGNAQEQTNDALKAMGLDF